MEDEHAVVGEDAGPGRVALERRELRARSLGRQAVQVRQAPFVDDDPLGFAHHGKAEDPLPGGQVCAERVCRADGRTGGDEREPPAHGGVVCVGPNVDAAERADRSCPCDRGQDGTLPKRGPIPPEAEQGWAKEAGNHGRA